MDKLQQKGVFLFPLFRFLFQHQSFGINPLQLFTLQNQVVDIAPEQYQKLRQDFLNSLTVEMLNQDLRQQLSNDMALILLQPKGEPEFNMKALQAVWDQIMAPSTAAATTSVATDDVHPEVTDIPPAQ